LRILLVPLGFNGVCLLSGSIIVFVREPIGTDEIPSYMNCPEVCLLGLVILGNVSCLLYPLLSVEYIYIQLLGRIGTLHSLIAWRWACGSAACSVYVTFATTLRYSRKSQ
jgi:hypothetical protein